MTRTCTRAACPRALRLFLLVLFAGLVAVLAAAPALAEEAAAETSAAAEAAARAAIARPAEAAPDAAASESAAPSAELPAAAASAQPSESFSAFCAAWMRKLAERERNNRSRVAFEPAGNAVVAEYTGYERAPRRCDARVSAPGAPGVGVLVYDELRYLKRGANSAEADASEAQVVERVEVMEVFRYDGDRWSY